MEILKTSHLSNKIICRPPQSCETIPLNVQYYDPDPDTWKYPQFNVRKKILSPELFSSCWTVHVL